MNRIDSLFSARRDGIMSIYFCAGHPDAGSTLATIKALEDNGIDMVEVGIPFSDPLADGPVIQDAATKALRNGMSLKLLFSQLADVRKSVSIPLVLMGYLNPIMHYGFERFCADCSRCGIDGMIVPDMPFDDYMNLYKDTAERYGIKVIMLITPETSDERIRLIDDNTDGFIYMVSSASTTGAQKSFDDSKVNYFRRIASMNLRNPRMIGFGISNRQTLESSMANAFGVIIGSRFVTLLDETHDAVKAITELKRILAE